MTAFQSVFVIRLGLLNTLRVLCSRELRRTPTIYYKTAGSWSRFFLGRRLKPIPDQDYDAFRGANYVDHRAYVTLEMAQEIFNAEPDRYLRRFLQQAMAWSVYEAIGIIQDCELMGSEQECSCVLVPINPFIDDLRTRYESKAIQLRWCFGTRRLRKFLSHIAAFALTTLQAFWNIRSHSRFPSSEASRPALSVLNFRGGSSFEQRNDFFWLTSPKPGYPIVFEYAATTYPLFSDFTDELWNRGIRIVETHRWRKQSAASEQWRAGRIYLRRSITSIARFLIDALAAATALSARHIWRAVHRLHFDLQRASRVDFCKRYNIKAELISGFTTNESVHSATMRELGGVSCTAQYTTAVDPWGSYTSTSTFHLNFGECVTNLGLPLPPDFTILNGYLFKTPLMRRSHAVLALRERFARLGVSRVICFLEDAFGENERPTRVTVEFCRFLFSRLLADPGLGVVIKPKKNALLAVYRRHLGRVFDDALASRRLIVLEWDHYPGLAGLAADLTIGHISTAALEVAVAGGRVIYLNAIGYVPQYMEEVRSLIYDSVPRAIADVELFLDGKGNPGLGVHKESFLRTMDAGRDTEVSERIEYVLSTCLNEIAGEPRAMKRRGRAIAELTKRWPVTVVSEGLGLAMPVETVYQRPYD